MLESKWHSTIYNDLKAVNTALLVNVMESTTNGRRHELGSVKASLLSNSALVKAVDGKSLTMQAFPAVKNPIVRVTSAMKIFSHVFLIFPYIGITTLPVRALLVAMTELDLT